LGQLGTQQVETAVYGSGHIESWVTMWNEGVKSHIARDNVSHCSQELSKQAQDAASKNQNNKVRTISVFRNG
jgi:hypothetical protein